MKVIDFNKAREVVLENRAAGKVYKRYRTLEGQTKIKAYREKSQRQKLIEAIAKLGQ